MNFKYDNGDKVGFISELSETIRNYYCGDLIPKDKILHGIIGLGEKYKKEFAKVVGYYEPYHLVEWYSSDNKLMRLGFKEEELYLINKNKSMNLKEKFILAITSEPKKSFRKAGITNGDDLLTEDGEKVFLTWLLEKNSDEFKKEVVDELLKEEEIKKE